MEGLTGNSCPSDATLVEFVWGMDLLLYGFPIICGPRPMRGGDFGIYEESLIHIRAKQKVLLSETHRVGPFALHYVSFEELEKRCFNPV